MSASRDSAALLSEGAVESLPRGALAKQLAGGRPLRVKLGIDPTASDIHLGHVVVLNKLRQFQDAGHMVVLIIGDYTARVGDPSGRSAERPVLSDEQIDANAASFQEQAFKVLDRERTEVRFNSEWLEMPSAELFRLIRNFTVARLLERDDFTKRMTAEQPISALELLYPVLQGYDSVATEADIELGGTDQKFNLLFGRDVQQACGTDPQSVMTLPILPGIEGKARMSKSAGNYIGITEPPDQIFGKAMRVPDAAMADYYRLVLGRGLDPALHAGEAKRELARSLVARFHGEAEAGEAEAHFDRLHVDRGMPDEIEEAEVSSWQDRQLHLPAALGEAFGLSRSEARRMIEQGAVRINGEQVPAETLDIAPDQLDGSVLQIGKRRHKRIRIAP